MSGKHIFIALGAGLPLICSAAETGPSNAALEKVFKDTVEQAPAVQMKPGQSCPRPGLRRFNVLKRGSLKPSTDTPHGFYPVTAEVELQCTQPSGGAATQWSGQVELQLYQNALQAWTVRW